MFEVPLPLGDSGGALVDGMADQLEVRSFTDRTGKTIGLSRSA